MLTRYQRVGIKSFNTSEKLWEVAPCDFAVNESFLVSVEDGPGDQTTIRVFCFEEVQMDGGQSTGLWN